MAEVYAQQQLRFGLGGLDLRRARDLVDVLNATRLTDIVRDPEGGYTSRPGQTSLATATGPLHSIARMDDLASGTPNLAWGGGTAVYAGLTGALSSIATGFSGSPLSLVPWQSTLNGSSWLIVGDSTKVVKVRASDNLVLPIGLAAPAAATTTALDTEHKTTIEDFENGFTGHIGTAGGGVPTLTYPAGKDNNCLQMQMVVGGATATYNSFADKGLTVDLSVLSGPVAATDEDFMHLWLRTNAPASIQEIRVYLITNAFTAGVIPGLDPTNNTQAFVKAFRSSDITAFVNTTSPAIAVTPMIVARQQVDLGSGNVPTENGLTAIPPHDDTTQSPTDPTSAQSTQQVAGANAWTEWGSIGIPLRRADFQAIGESPDWSQVKGIALYASTTGALAPIIQIDQFYLTGGEGPDTSEPGVQKYDYLATNYDPRTGAEGNPSPVMADTAWQDSLRRGIVVTPPAHSDAAMRQRVYRRGGTLTSDWYFVAVNTSNGGTVLDTFSDAALVDADNPPTDHFAAVPSVSSAGAAVLAQPVPYWWGPTQGIVFAAGDPHRPGSVYFCKPDQLDAWGANDYVNVCAPTERIIGGFTLSSFAFAWSTKRLYALNVNLNASSSVSSVLTGTTRGPASPWAFAVGGGVCGFLASDGCFLTNGGVETNLTDDWLRPLFRGQTVNGYAPIDFAQQTALRAAFYQNEFWFQYQDTSGGRHWLIYHILDKVWRVVTFGQTTAVAYPDVVPGTNRLLLGSVAGAAYTHAGTADGGLAIAPSLRLGDLNQGYPKASKYYADFTIEADAKATTVTVTPLTDNETVASTALTIPGTSAGRQPYIYSWAPQPLRGQNLSLDFAWSTTEAAPVLYLGTITYAPEPPTLTSLSSLPMDHGILGWQFPSSALVTLRSNAAVTLTVTRTNQTGGLATQTYTIPSTGFLKQKMWIPFSASKGVLYSYQLTSTLPFIVYAAESTVTAQAWGSPQTTISHPFVPAGENSESFAHLTTAAALTPGSA